MTIHWSTPAWMWPLLLVGAAGAVLWAVWAYGRTQPLPPQRLRRILTVLRSTAFVLLVLAIAGPVFSRLLTRTRPAEVAIVLEDSGSMVIADAAGDTTQERWAAALAVAARLDSVFADHDPPIVPVVLRGNGLVPLVEINADDPAIAPPTGHGTNLEELGRQVADRLAGRPVRATILLADGQETVGLTGPDGRRGSLARRTNPLLVVGVGDAEGPPDRVLKDLRYPDAAYQGDEVVVEFAVDHRYLGGSRQEGPARSITARLVGPDGPVATTTVESAEKLVPFEMTFRPTEVGLQVYDLEVEVLDNERFPANNRASIAINVRQERARILLLTAAPSWDVRFLAQAASLEQRVALTVVHPAAHGLVYADSLRPWVAPADAKGWRTWDAVILAGWTGPLAGLDWGVLGQAVEQGLGLLVMAGSTSGPGGGPMPFPPPDGLAGLLPVSTTGWRWLPGPFFVGVPAAAAGHPVVAGLGATGDGNAEESGLGSLPPLAEVTDTSPSAGTEALLTARPSAGAAAERPVLVVAGRGQGRVAWFGGRHLWELAFWESSRGKAGAADETQAGRRLARNLLVWAAAGLEESGLVFTGRQTFFQEGEPIRLGAQWRDMRGRPVTDRALQLVLRGAGAAGDSTSERTYSLRMSGARPGLAEVELPPLAPGRYTVQLVGEGEPPVLGRPENLVVADHSIEMTQVRMDRRRLTQLASRGGGRFYDAGQPADLQALVDDLSAVDWTGDRVEQRSRLDVRSGWPLLVLVSALLAAEWYLRRRHGLL